MAKAGQASRTLSRRTGLWIFLIAVCCHVPGIEWGLPSATSPERVRLWAYDDISPLPVLTEIYHTLVERSADRWLAYPLQHYFTLGLFYAPYLGWLAMTGEIATPTPSFPYGLRDPLTALRVLTIIARIVSILMAAGIVLAAYRLGKLLWDERTAVFAATATLVQYPFYYYSKTACLDVPYVFWWSWSLVIAIDVLIRGLTTWRTIGLALCAASAAATKDQAAGLFLFLPFFLAVVWRRHRVSSPGKVARFVGLFTLSGLTAYSLGSGLALDPERYVAHVKFLFFRDTTPGAEFLQWNPPEAKYPRGLQAIPQLVHWTAGQLSRSLGRLLASFSLLGLIAAALRGHRSLWLVASVGGYWLAFIVYLSHGYRFGRYLIPVSFVLGIFGAFGLTLLAQLHWPARWLRAVPPAVAGLAFLLPAHRSVDLLRHLRHDSRYDAERWFAKNAVPGDRVAALHSVNALPRLPREITIVTPPTGDAGSHYVYAFKPEFVTVIPDWTSSLGMPHSRMYPRELFAKLEDGSLGYAQVASFDCGFSGGLPLLDYPSVSPPVTIYRRIVRGLRQ